MAYKKQSKLFVSMAALVMPMCVSTLPSAPPQKVPTFPTTDHFQKQVRRVCERAQAEQHYLPKPVVELFFEGKLDSDPQHIASRESQSDATYVFHAAACAAASPDSWRAEGALKRTTQILDAWSQTYLPKGNPINDSHFLPFFESLTLIWPKLTGLQQISYANWIRQFITAGDIFYQGDAASGKRAIVTHSNSDTRTKNNWQTWRLAIRGVAAKLLNDSAELRNTEQMINNFVSDNIFADGSGIDFKDRDALHYHVYNLKAWIELAVFTPEVLTPFAQSRIEQALLFIKPYYEGTLQNIEFEHSIIKFDAARRDAGQPEFQNIPWKPESANELLRVARCVFPAIQPWTTLLDHSSQASPRVKFLAAMLCEGDFSNAH